MPVQQVLTTASTVLCGLSAPKLHGGMVAKSGAPKLTVGGLTQHVLVANSLGAVSGCQNAPPPAGATACLKVVSLGPTGISTKLTVGGAGVLLTTITAQGKTNGTPPGTLVASGGPAKLRAG
jgi:hypothetical protein